MNTNQKIFIGGLFVIPFVISIWNDAEIKDIKSKINQEQLIKNPLMRLCPDNKFVVMINGKATCTEVTASTPVFREPDNSKIDKWANEHCYAGGAGATSGMYLEFRVTTCWESMKEVEKENRK